MSYIKDRIFVFDIETVIDVESSRSFLGLSEKITNEEVIAKIKQYHIDNSFSGSDFVKPPFHKVVAISYLDAIVHVNVDGKEEYEIMNIKSGGNIEDKESELVKGFFNYLEKLDARLITFNGRSFDLPVLKYRAMKYDIEANWLYARGDKWNNYTQRYSMDWHCDLLEAFTDYNASTRIKMSEVAGVYGIPCKVDVDGSQVEDLYNRNEIEEIRNYCEQDVLCTYLLYLKYTNHTGRITSRGYKKCIDNLREFVVAQDKEHSKSVIKNLKLSK
ncbi:MAG: 3'-5' exonuclease [Gammaproteobacteria bacterium]|jgi:3'-5' exonuclease|nr:3'-5' exonuclease [Gammaproteobacteria bacterium]